MTYEGTEEGTGDVILYMEDGSYKTMSTEEVYNNINKDYANKYIVDLLEVNYSEADGKLYIKVKWHTGEESLIDAQDLKADEPLRLANFLLENPVEKLRSGYWNEWAKKTAKSINCALRRLCHMYEFEGTTDSCNFVFRRARRAKTKKHKNRVKFSGGCTMLFGLEVPHNVREALELDRRNGSHR